MYYSEELVEEVRMKNNIIDVISGYVQLKKRGGSYVGLCPFHNEKTGSFHVSAEKQMYHCFGCGAGGNVFTFLMEYERLSFPEAVKELAQRGGVELPEEDRSEEARRQESHREKLLKVNKAAAAYYYYLLRQKEGAPGLRYLEGRGLDGETIHKFGLGFASKYSDDLSRYLKSKGYSDELLKEAGLSTVDEKYGVHDKFWNRVMFPIQDLNHRVIGFGGRVMGEGTPKYLNSPETPIFDKSRNLYGLNFARSSRSGDIILCEGYMDVIAMHQAGFTQAVASLGTAFTAGQANLLSRYTQKALLAYDSDAAGVRAALRAIGILREAGLSSRVIRLEPYKDPDELIKGLGAEEFQKRLSEAENSFFFELRILERDYDLKDPDSKTLFQKEIAQRLCGFSEEAMRENYLEAAAEKYRIGIETLRRQVVECAARTGLEKEIVRPRSGIQKKPAPESGFQKSQRLLLSWLIEEPALYGKIRRYIAPSDFTEGLYRRAAEALFEELERGDVRPASVISRFTEEEEQREAASLFHESFPVSEPDRREREKVLYDTIVGIKSGSLAYLTDTDSLLRGRKALEELRNTHISLD